MSGLEKIIRPYETRLVTPPKPVISVIKNGTQTDNVVLEYGKSWNIKSLNGSETVDVTYYMEKLLKETSHGSIISGTGSATDTRLSKRKRIRIGEKVADPDNRPYVDIPIVNIAKILGTNGQVFFYKLANDTDNNLRKTHVKRVKAATKNEENISYDDTNYVDVERVEIAALLGTNGQVENYRFNNFDPPPMTPEGFDEPRHYRKHFVRYYYNNNDTEDTWVDVERIDRMKIIGTNGQDFQVVIHNPTAQYLRDTYGQAQSGKYYGDEINDPDDPYSSMYDANNNKYPLILGYCSSDLELLPEEEAV